MLKLTYTENSFSLERLAQPLEEWVTNRTILALRTATTLCVDPSTASFLLPADLPYIASLERAIQREEIKEIAISVCDADYIEVSLNGTWISSGLDNDEGILVASLSDRVEFFLITIWQAAQTLASLVRE